jgi:hypothetical protein
VIRPAGKVFEIPVKLVFPSGPTAEVEGKITGIAGKLLQHEGKIRLIKFHPFRVIHSRTAGGRGGPKLMVATYGMIFTVLRAAFFFAVCQE